MTPSLRKASGAFRHSSHFAKMSIGNPRMRSRIWSQNEVSARQLQQADLCRSVSARKGYASQPVNVPMLARSCRLTSDRTRRCSTVSPYRNRNRRQQHHPHSLQRRPRADVPQLARPTASSPRVRLLAELVRRNPHGQQYVLESNRAAVHANPHRYIVSPPLLVSGIPLKLVLDSVSGRVQLFGTSS